MTERNCWASLMDILLIFRPNNEKRMCVYTKASLRGNMVGSCISAPSVASSEALSALRTEPKVGCFSVSVLEDTLMCPINVDFGEVVKPLNDKEICHISHPRVRECECVLLWSIFTINHYSRPATGRLILLWDFIGFCGVLTGSVGDQIRTSAQLQF